MRNLNKRIIKLCDGKIWKFRGILFWIHKVFSEVLNRINYEEFSLKSLKYPLESTTNNVVPFSLTAIFRIIFHSAFMLSFWSIFVSVSNGLFINITIVYSYYIVTIVISELPVLGQCITTFESSWSKDLNHRKCAKLLYWIKTIIFFKYDPGEPQLYITHDWISKFIEHRINEKKLDYESGTKPPKHFQTFLLKKFHLHLDKPNVINLWNISQIKYYRLQQM